MAMIRSNRTVVVDEIKNIIWKKGMFANLKVSTMHLLSLKVTKCPSFPNNIDRMAVLIFPLFIIVHYENEKVYENVIEGVAHVIISFKSIKTLGTWLLFQ